MKGFYQQVKRYELFQTLKEEASSTGLAKSLSDDYMGTGLNSEEYWLLFWNNSMIDGTKKASYEALDFAKAMFPGEAVYLDRGDGFRHAIWNALIAKHTGNNHNTVGEATSWAKKYTDAHENGSSTQPADPRDNTMDFHNNGEGRSYFSSVAWVHKFKSFWFFGWHYGYDVYAPETNTIKSSIYNKTLQGTRFSNNSQLPGFIGKIVWIN